MQKNREEAGYEAKRSCKQCFFFCMREMGLVPSTHFVRHEFVSSTMVRFLNWTVPLILWAELSVQF